MTDHDLGAHDRDAVIIGGGIAGLAAATALGRAGWKVTVLEQAVVFWEAGAGLTLTPTGQRALSDLAVANRIRDTSQLMRPAGVRGVDGRWLVRYAERRDDWQAWAIHRRSLHAALLDAANEVADLRPGARVLDLGVGSVRGAPAQVRWLDETGEHAMTAGLVVGADGARSLVRPAVAVDAETGPSGYIAWRAVVATDEPVGKDWITWWGSGLECSVQPLGPQRASWYCLLRRGQGADDLAEVHRRLDGWPAELRELVTSTPKGAAIRHDIIGLRGVIHSLVAGRAVLIGDAAYPMLPTVSQGANLAIADGVALGRALRRSDDLARGLTAYDRERLPHRRRVARRAALIGALGAGCPPGLPEAIRDRALRGVPDRWARTLLDGIVT
jgi:2-polyprenyl-6-methoxyphenol hydroxylase-like FAD-dependent oxidoreductase